ncbi:hypothetical protein ACSBM8_02915 [Sphingomonas sp. ASY06-1R]|uniref:hypothetical protein n=1 Tax=Sphingomonas sp. ASY06-1R TaxID=3445771 RepID=UPI003FA2217A
MELTVSQKSPGAPISLSITSQSINFTGCIDVASIYPVGRAQDLTWQAGRSDQERCIQGITVGSPERGFVQSPNPPSLPDGAYCAQVSGPGFNAWRRFIIRNKVAMQENGGPGMC